MSFPDSRCEFQLHNRQLGARGESLAEKFFQQSGYSIIDRNYHCRFGELDLVAEKDGELALIEVKTRDNRNCGLAIESVTRAKKRKLLKAAYSWLALHRRFESVWRIDVVTLDREKDGSYRLQHFPSAVRAEDVLGQNL